MSVCVTWPDSLRALGPSVPDAARRLANAISLHDGLLRGVERTNGRLELLFRAGDQQVGYFDAWHRYDGVGSITVPRCGLTIRVHPRTLMIVISGGRVQRGLDGIRRLCPDDRRHEVHRPSLHWTGLNLPDVP